MIKIKNLTFIREKQILKNISLKIHEKNLTILIGPNGAGKTTLLKIIAGILTDFEGEVIIGKDNIRELSKREIAKYISFQPQSEEFLLPITVKDVLLSGRYPYKKLFSDYDRTDMELYENCISKFEISNITSQDINTLSSGERRRVLIASAYIQDVPVLLFDEPFSNLDPEGEADLKKVFEELKKEGKTILVVTHNLEPLFSLTDYIISLREGTILYSGDKSSTSEVLRETYNIDFEKIVHKNKEIYIPL